LPGLHIGEIEIQDITTGKWGVPVSLFLYKACSDEQNELLLFCIPISNILLTPLLPGSYGKA
jgi:hypothetical protein